MRYRLRTLLVVLAIGPMVLAGAYLVWEATRPKILKIRIVETPSTAVFDSEGNAYDADGTMIFKASDLPDE